MLTKTKLALAAVLVAGTASLAVAQEADPNLYNRYPADNGPVAAAPQGTFQSAPVGLSQGRNVGQVQRSRPQVQTFHYDSAPLVSGGGY
jgi:hypothetical protein